MEYNSFFSLGSLKSYEQWLDDFHIPFKVNDEYLKGKYLDICKINELACVQYNTPQLYYNYKNNHLFWINFCNIMLFFSKILGVLLILSLIYTPLLRSIKFLSYMKYTTLSLCTLLFSYYFHSNSFLILPSAVNVNSSILELA